MAQEIERKFLVKDDSYRKMADSSSRIRQGYICSMRGRTVRVPGGAFRCGGPHRGHPRHCVGVRKNHIQNSPEPKFRGVQEVSYLK